MVHPFPGFPPLRNASAERRVKSNPLQINLTPKPKTSSAILKILKILKILIQNQAKGGKFIIYTCRGEDAKHRVSTVILYKNSIMHPYTLPSMEILRAAATGFESGFTGFPGLTITSLVGVGRLLLNGASISWLSAAA
jgi:hypothetical protein